jgi:hypothetical protein
MIESVTFSITTRVAIAFSFLILNAVILELVLAVNRRAPKTNGTESAVQKEPGLDHLSASDILGWEFEYAQTTASEAMKDRHTMINFYLIVVGVVASGVVAILKSDETLPKEGATALLWLLCGVGWLYFLKLIRLRQAWYDSALAMSTIKEFYFQHAQQFQASQLEAAFRWKRETLPPPEKSWTVFFCSAMLIAYLDSAAYTAGGIFLCDAAARSWSVIGILVVLGLIFSGYHCWLYYKFLER